MNIDNLTIPINDLSQEELSEINGGNPIGFIVRAVTFVAAGVSLSSDESIIDTINDPKNNLYKREMQKLRDKQKQ